jgi:hypothetical protein
MLVRIDVLIEISRVYVGEFAKPVEGEGRHG